MIVAAFSPSLCFADCGGGLVDDLVLRLPSRLEREVVAVEGEREADDIGLEHPQRLVQELLPGLVPFEDGNRRRRH